MSTSNIAIVIAPNLMWASGDSGPNVLTTATQSQIVESLIQHADYFFPGDIQFGLGPSSEKGTPPGTLNTASTRIYPSLEDFSVNTALSLSPTSSATNLQADNRQALIDTASPRSIRRNKRVAPPPPAADKPHYRQHAPAALEKPAITSDKPQVSPAGYRPSASPGGSLERPSLSPPPAPPKPASPGGTAAAAAAHYDAHTGSSSAAITSSSSSVSSPLGSLSRKDKPKLHDKPSSDKFENHSHCKLPGLSPPIIIATAPAADTTKPSLTTSTTASTTAPLISDNFNTIKPAATDNIKPSSAGNNSTPASLVCNHNNTSAAAAVVTDINDLDAASSLTSTSGYKNDTDSNKKNNSLPRNLNKPPRPPRPVTMISRESKGDAEEINGKVNTTTSAIAEQQHQQQQHEGHGHVVKEKKMSSSEETHL